MTYYVKMIGASDMPLSNEPFKDRGELMQEVRFPKRPLPKGFTKGDQLVYYAVGGYKKIFAVAQLEGEPKPDAPHSNPVVAKRWPFAAPVSFLPFAKLRYVSSGPDLNEVGARLQQKVGHGVSHFEIGRPEFDRAVELLRKAKTVEDMQLKRKAQA